MKAALPRLLLVVGFAGLVAAALIAVLSAERVTTPVEVPPVFVPTPVGVPEDAPEAQPFQDPFSYDPERRREFETRAAAGNSHVLYVRSPEGATATAARVAKWRPLINEAAAEAGVSASRLEALVYLESAGREDVVAPQGPEGAVGLTQIVAETGTSLLGMSIDLAASERIGRQMQRALRRADQQRYERLRRERRRVDERLDPAKALAASGRYLKIAEEKFRSEELAFVSYHMGMGNLSEVLELYAGGPTDEPLRYAQVYFDSSPTRHRTAYAKLASLGDDSSNYLWKLLAARDIMKLFREDPGTLADLEALHAAKNSAEEVLHPEGSVEIFDSPAELKQAWDGGEIVGLPVDTRATGLRINEKMGQQAKKIGQRESLYRGLRPPTLAMALYVGAQVREAARDPAAALTVTSTVRDRRYQARLVKTNPEATPNYSLHTTGYAFDVLRRYRSKKQALAFQFVLDRLVSLNLIAYVFEPAAIHVTVSGEAAALEPLLDRVAP